MISDPHFEKLNLKNSLLVVRLRNEAQKTFEPVKKLSLVMARIFFIFQTNNINVIASN